MELTQERQWWTVAKGLNFAILWLSGTLLLLFSVRYLTSIGRIRTLPKAQRSHCLNEASAVLKKIHENVLLWLVVAFLIFLWREIMKLIHRIQYSNLLHFRHSRIHANFSRIKGSSQTRFDPFVLSPYGLIFYEQNTIFNKTFPLISLRYSCLNHVIYLMSVETFDFKSHKRWTWTCCVSAQSSEQGRNSYE